MTPGTWPAGPIVAALLLAGCSAGNADPPAGGPGSPARTSSPSGSASAAAGPGTAGPDTSAPPSLPRVVDPVSLPALMARDYDGRALRTREVLARTDAYTRYAVRFRSGDLRISGVMNVPRGNGPFPVLVLLHGYIGPAVYVTGQGLLREQDYLARHGYVALHVDYEGTPSPTPRRVPRAACGWATRSTRSTRCTPCADRRCPTWTVRGSGCSAGRWAAASSTTC